MVDFKKLKPGDKVKPLVKYSNYWPVHKAEAYEVHRVTPHKDSITEAITIRLQLLVPKSIGRYFSSKEGTYPKIYRTPEGKVVHTIIVYNPKHFELFTGKAYEVW